MKNPGMVVEEVEILNLDPEAARILWPIFTGFILRE
jgi:hypothetical protein